MIDALNMSLALPEIILLVSACILLLLVGFLGDKVTTLIYGLSQLTLVGLIITVYMGMGNDFGLAYHQTYIKDGLSDLLKLIIYGGNIAILNYSRHYLKAREVYQSEFYILTLFATLGMSVMVSAHHLLTIYLGLELMSLCLYAMVALHRHSLASTEAAMKYFILGALASGMLLYGMSMVYGVTQSLAISDISTVSAQTEQAVVLNFALVFIVIGIAFKLGAVPFHMWLPDVYQGAATATTILIATTPKLAAFAMLIRLLVEGMGSLHTDWYNMIMLLALASIILGNLTALAQTNIKRLFAYSTISHIGFILLGLLSGTADGYSAALFYTISYVVMSIAGFGLVLIMSRKGFEAEDITDYRGLGTQHPWFALMMLLVLFSMAGIPPLIGFYAKLAVLKSVVDTGLYSIAIIAVLMSVIGAFYYLKVIKVIYFETTEQMPVAIEASADVKWLLSINAMTVLVIGLFPSGLMTLCHNIFV